MAVLIINFTHRQTTFSNFRRPDVVIHMINHVLCCSSFKSFDIKYQVILQFVNEHVVSLPQHLLCIWYRKFDHVECWHTLQDRWTVEILGTNNNLWSFHLDFGSISITANIDNHNILMENNNVLELELR